jgi:hypothetical protein
MRARAAGDQRSVGLIGWGIRGANGIERAFTR